MQYRDGHISTCLIKTLVIYLCCGYCACASYLFIIVTRYYLFVLRIRYCRSFILFCSLFDYLFVLLFYFISHRFFCFIHCSLFKREKYNSDPELCSDILILHTCSTSSIQVNKHHTADSTDFVLVEERRTFYHHRYSGIDETNIST